MADAWFDAFFDGLYGEVLASHGTAQANDADARVIRELLAARKGDRVLDVGCGMGRITIPLARTGLAMTGVDLNARYIHRAQQTAAADGLDVRFLEQDMRRIDFERDFDAAFSWFTSFGYFPSRENLACLRRIRQALKPGGRLLIELSNKSWVLAHFRPHEDTTVAGVRVVEERRYDAANGRMKCTWTLSKGRKREIHQISLQMYNGSDMRALLKRAGFVDVTLYGRPPLGRFTRHSQRLIAVASRPRVRA